MLLIASYSFASAPVTALLDEARHPKEPRCATQLVRSVRDNWDAFSPEEREELDQLLAPRGLSLDPDRAAPQAPPQPPGNPTTSCWDAEYDTVLAGDHFELQYDASDITTSTANTFLEALEFSWETEVDELGWNAPDGTNAWLIPVYVDPTYSNGAYTTVQQCGNGYYPYIVIGANSFSNMDWAKTTAAHEFNHAIQFATSFAPEGWWWEATATYIEESVYPNSNEWAPYITGYTYNPHLRMNADGQTDYDEFNHMYGMAVWGFYLDEYQGGSDIVRQTWEAAEDDRGYYSTTMADMLADIGVDFDAAYLDFVARNAVMDYREHRLFPSVDTVSSVKELPAEDSSSSKTEPEGYGQNFYKIPAGTGEGNLEVELTAEDGGAWAVVLAEVDDDSVLRSVSTSLPDGVGTLTLEDIGANDVYMIFSPTQDTKKGQAYTWAARLVEDVPEDSGNVVKDSPEDAATACGCSAATSTTLYAPLLTSMLALTMLRRRGSRRTC